MSLTVVIPVYNHLTDTLLTLDTLAATTMCDVIVVDDGSTDGTRHALDAKYLTYIANEENLGVNASWNVGIRAAIESGATYICVANNDLAFSPGWWRPLKRALDGGAAVVSPYSTIGHLPSDWPAGGDRRTNPCSSVMDLLGSCFAFRASLIERIGYFPEDMRHYYGDNWLQDSCKRHGLIATHVRDSYVHHFGMHTTAELPGSQLEADRLAYEDYKRRTWR